MVEFGNKSEIGIPPDSSGKKMDALFYISVSYEQSSRDFILGERVKARNSNVVGLIIRSKPSEIVATSGEISIAIDRSSVGTSLVNGEIIEDFETTSAIATVSSDSEEKNYLQPYILSGGNNPLNRQFVDQRGAAYTRFSEGSPQLSGFGLTRHADPEVLIFNTFDHGFSDFFADGYAAGSGASSLIIDERFFALDVGTDSGAAVDQPSSIKSISFPGIGHLVTMSIASGDSGKTGVTRRWGYYDDNDGVFFEQEDSDLYLVVRSSATGSTIDVKIPQSDWNGDVLDGSGNSSNVSSVNLFVENINIYWFDIRWMGTGNIRAGIWAPEGSDRIIAHSFTGVNSTPIPNLTNHSLPVRFEIFNTTNTSSPSRLKMGSFAVFSDGKIPRRPDLLALIIPLEHSIVTDPDGYETYVASYRASPTLFSGLPNRKRAVPEFMTIVVRDAPIHFKFYVGSVLSGDSFVQKMPDGAIEVDTSGELLGGLVYLSFMFGVGTHQVNLDKFFSVMSGAAHIKNNGNPTDNATFTISTLQPGTAATVDMSVLIMEV